MVRLTEADAVTRLHQMVQGNEEPALTAEELADILELARRADGEGRAPSHADWDPTWDLNAAAAEGWRRKAGKVAGLFNAQADGASLSRSDLFAHCTAMAKQYGRRVAMSVVASSPRPYSLENGVELP